MNLEKLRLKSEEIEIVRYLNIFKIKCFICLQLNLNNNVLFIRKKMICPYPECVITGGIMIDKETGEKDV